MCCRPPRRDEAQSGSVASLTGAEGTHHSTELLLQNRVHLDDSEVNGEGKEC